MTPQILKISRLSLVALFAGLLLSEQATASKNEKSSNEEIGEKIGKVGKKAEHAYKKHVEKPLKEIKEGFKKGKEEQKGKCKNMKAQKEKENK